MPVGERSSVRVRLDVFPRVARAWLVVAAVVAM